MPVVVEFNYDDKQVRDALKKLRDRWPTIKKRIMSRFGEAVIRIAQDKYLNVPEGLKSSTGLHSRTGLLSSSVRRTTIGFDRVDVYVGTNVKYAPILHFGGTITIVPVRKKVLSWKGPDGVRRFAMKVTVKIPARPYLSQPIKDLFKGNEGVRIAENTIAQGIKEAGLV